MQKIIVSDTSCLILLQKIGRLSLLKQLFGKVKITSVVAKEFGAELPDFIEIENPENTRYQNILESFLDSGESSAIALAIEKQDVLLIIDENKARQKAKQLKLKYTGTIGILIVAKQKNYINSITEIIQQILQTDFRISKALIEEARRRCNE
ncbi:MAG: DUF3368 domain-containing protein [Chitinophagales bacterium]